MQDAHGLAWALRRQGWPGVEEVVVGHRTVTVVVDPERAQLGELAEAAAKLAPSSPGELSPRTVEVPVVFDGPDLEEVARFAGRTTGGVAEALIGAELVVAMVGFVPGFGYLEGLGGPLASVPRRASPRSRVEAGSVALAGGYAGVYPVASPGGWQLVGHTATKLFDRDMPPYAVLRPGDRVRFLEADPTGSAAEPRPPQGARAALCPSGAVPSLRVLRAGLCTTIQDARPHRGSRPRRAEGWSCGLALGTARQPGRRQPRRRRLARADPDRRHVAVRGSSARRARRRWRDVSSTEGRRRPERFIR